MGLVGLGSVLLAPSLVPVVGTLVRPVLKGLIWGALAVTESTLHLLTEVGEQVSQLYTEARQDAEQTQSAGITPPDARIVTPEMSTARPAATLVTPEGKPVSEV